MKCPTRFICFIHIPKTAGSSVSDLFTPSDNIDYDLLKSNPPETVLINKGHQYCCEVYNNYHRGWLQYIKAHYRPWPGYIEKKYWMHFSPSEKDNIGYTEYLDIPILSIVRNPFDRLRSIYNFYIATNTTVAAHGGPDAPSPNSHIGSHIKQHVIRRNKITGKTYKTLEKYPTYFDPRLSFTDFILKFEDIYFRKNEMFGTCYDHLSIENQLLTTDILKFENLKSDLKLFCKKYNISLNIDHLPHKNYGVKYDKKKLNYNKKMIKIVERLFEKDLNEFKYSYDQLLK